MLSFPQPIQNDDAGVKITVGSQLNNTVHFYPSFSKTGNCFIDLDLSEDSDKDGDPIFDRDILCNELGTKVFDTARSKLEGAIYYVNEEVLFEKKLEITFLDNIGGEDVEVPEELRDVADRIDELIGEIESGEVEDDTYYGLLLDNLRRSLVDDDDVDSIVLQLHEYVATSRMQLPDDHRDKLDVLLLSLTDETLQAAI